MTMILAMLAIAVSGQAKCVDPAFDAQVRRYLKGTIPALDVDQLARERGSTLVLDARERQEYVISHIPGARHIGFKDLNLEALDGVPKETRIVVYCSIGYRSERVAERLKAQGYHDVYNVHGSIFEWVNRGHAVQDSSGEVTNRIHAYSRSWSRWILNGAMEKVW
ncbi:MAG: rhodanese-like domain-containing protein [Saprospiraceae bacterium]|nr:rhodanese-like domain-containing protein [Saprospiraceae bacterium]